jgi:hypothetical protein
MPRASGWSHHRRASAPRAGSLQHPVADGVAELPRRQRIEREFQNNVNQAESEKNAEPEGITVEVQDARNGANGTDKRQSPGRNVGPANDTARGVAAVGARFIGSG